MTSLCDLFRIVVVRLLEKKSFVFPYRPLKGAKGFTESDHKAVFSNVTDLLTLHVEFHGMVKAQMDSTTGRKLSVPFMTCIPKMHIYGQFCCDVPEVRACVLTRVEVSQRERAGQPDEACFG